MWEIRVGSCIGPCRREEGQLWSCSCSGTQQWREKNFNLVFGTCNTMSWIASLWSLLATLKPSAIVFLHYWIIRNVVTQSTILQIFSAARLSKNNNNAYSSVRKLIPFWGTNLITGIIVFLPGIFIGLPGFFTRDCRNRIVFTRDG